jgi:protoporphyrinogen oxidase
MKNVIIGAGLSGLSCGHFLRDAAILESDISIGGLAKTLHFENFAFDLGGHRFLTGKPRIDKFIKDLLGDELAEVERKSKIFKNNRFFDYPISPNIVFQMNSLRLLLAAITYLFRKIKPLKSRSFREKIINKFGDEVYRYYFKDYTKKVWGVPCCQISPDWVSTRIGSMSLYDVISYSFIKKYNLKSLADKFLYPRSGIGVIAERLASGLNIELNAKVTGMSFSQNCIKSVIVNNKKEIECKAVISTMPITGLASMLDPPADVRRAISGLKYRDLICVFLTIDKENYSDNHWIYFPGKEIFGRIHEPKKWSKYLAPDGRTGICVEIFTHRDEPLWQKDDLEIAHAVIKDLPFAKGIEIQDHIVERVKNAYPLYRIDYGKNLWIIKDFLSRYKNLYTIGRTGNFNYLNMDDCIEEGLSLAEVLNKEAEKGSTLVV